MKIQLFRVISLCVCVAEYLYKVNPQQVCSEFGHPNMITRYHANLLHPPGQPRAHHLHSWSTSAPISLIPSAFRNHVVALFASTGTRDSVKRGFSGIWVDSRNYHISELPWMFFFNTPHKSKLHKNVPPLNSVRLILLAQIGKSFIERKTDLNLWEDVCESYIRRKKGKKEGKSCLMIYTLALPTKTSPVGVN